MLYDKDIREPLFEFLETEYGKIRIIEEKTMGKSRADVLMVMESALVGVEIKSDADTYARLERQVKDYNIFFDYNMVVVGSSHAYHIEEHVPEWWGIVTVEEAHDNIDFYCYRRMQPNPKPRFKKQLTFLWRPELAHIQELNHLPKYKEKSKKFVLEKLIEKVPEEQLKEQMCQELFERDYNSIGEKIAEYKRAQGRPVRRSRKKRRKG